MRVALGGWVSGRCCLYSIVNYILGTQFELVLKAIIIIVTITVTLTSNYYTDLHLESYNYH